MNILNIKDNKIKKIVKQATECVLQREHFIDKKAQIQFIGVIVDLLQVCIILSTHHDVAERRYHH